MSRTVPVEDQAAHAEREAFDHALASCFPELLQAAEREVRHRLTLGQFAPDNPTPEELLERALQYAWRERRRWPPELGVKAWALASIFRAGEALGAREAQRRRRMTELLPRSSNLTRCTSKTTRTFGSYTSWIIPGTRKSSPARSIACVRTPRTTMSLSAGSLRANGRSCSCTRSTAWHCKRSRWHSGFRRLKRIGCYQVRGIACAPQAVRRNECVALCIGPRSTGGVATDATAGRKPRRGRDSYLSITPLKYFGSVSAAVAVRISAHNAVRPDLRLLYGRFGQRRRRARAKANAARKTNLFTENLLYRYRISMRCDRITRNPRGFCFANSPKPAIISSPFFHCETAEANDHQNPGAPRAPNVVRSPTTPLIRRRQAKKTVNVRVAKGGIRTARAPRTSRTMPSMRNRIQCRATALQLRFGAAPVRPTSLPTSTPPLAADD
jgi:hypothetical protein